MKVGLFCFSLKSVLRGSTVEEFQASDPFYN